MRGRHPPWLHLLTKVTMHKKNTHRLSFFTPCIALSGVLQLWGKTRDYTYFFQIRQISLKFSGNFCLWFSEFLMEANSLASDGHTSFAPCLRMEWNILVGIGYGLLLYIVVTDSYIKWYSYVIRGNGVASCK